MHWTLLLKSPHPLATQSVASKDEAYKFGLEDSAASVSSFLQACSRDANKDGCPGELRLSQV